MERTSILVIDDDYFTRKLLDVLLTQAGYSVYQADNTEQALRILTETSIDVITCDVMMPGVDGIAFLASIKENPQCQDIPVVIITAAGRKEIIDKAKSLGADIVLEKPFTAETVKEAVRAAQGLL